MAAVVPAGYASAAHRRPGAVLVNESFTGATADSRLIGYGAACLTGARRGGRLAEGANHPLGGCHPDPAGPVPPAGAAPHGYLQLTDAHFEETGAVLFDSPVSAKGGLEVTFEQWQYGSTTRTPADGISFFLTDGARRLTTPGAFGGSLGYAQKVPDGGSGGQFVPGVDGGYLGIGLDVLGDYFGDGEKRGNGCQRRSPAGTRFQAPSPGPNIVTARGPGNGVEGYCYLDASTSNKATVGPWASALPGRLHGNLKKMPARVTPTRSEALLEPVKRAVRIVIPPGPRPVATVDIDFRDGDGFQRVLRFRAPEPVPSTFKFGFAASTGPLTDVHLIRKVTLRSVT
ncbi:lectin-like domain-containing protein [Spirillospora sp. CA-128828]|uniref:lectin-like domain-containing protein n=1 Tax=Spirillospora sp. CA-128828 TaxID=3240033 RepID=UPI003D8F2E2F